MSIGRDTQISELNSNSSFYDWFVKENSEIIAKLNLMNTFTVEGTNGITAPIDTNGKATISLSGKVDQGISFNGPAYFNGFVSIPNIAVKVDSINTSRTGFTFGTPVRIYYDIDTSSVTYEPCRATDPDQAEVYGVISQITSSYSYITLLGKIDGDFSAVNDRGIGLTAGWIYFLSGTTGHITDIEPNIAGYVSKPVIMGISGSSGLVLQMRGDYLESTVSGLTGGSSNEILTIVSADDARPDISEGTFVSLYVFPDTSYQNGPNINSYLSNTNYATIETYQLASFGTTYKSVLVPSVATVSAGITGSYSPFPGSSFPLTRYSNYDSNHVLGMVESIEQINSLYHYRIRTSGLSSVIPTNIQSVVQPRAGLLQLSSGFNINGPLAQLVSIATSTPDETSNQFYLSNHIAGAIIGNQFLVINKHDSSGSPIYGQYFSSPSVQASTSSISTENNVLINGNFNIWQRDTGRGLTHTSDGNVIFADLWRRHDGITGSSTSKNYYIIRREFDDYQSDIEGNPEYYIDIKGLGISAIGLTGATLYSETDHLMIGHVVPGAKKFDKNLISVKFYAKSSYNDYDLDVYLSRYTGNTLLDYIKMGTVNLSTSWSSYSLNTYIPTLEDNGTPISLIDDYCEVGFDLIPLIHKANLNGITLSDNLYVSIASVAASVSSSTSCVYPDYEEQLKYCQKFYYESYARNENDGSITLSDSTTPTQNTISQFIMPNKTCSLFTWPNQMRTTPTVTLYSPATGVSNRIYNKTASNSTTLLDTISTCGTIGYGGSIRECKDATFTTTPTVYGVNICVSGGIVNYDEVYYHIIADADFTL